MITNINQFNKLMENTQLEKTNEEFEKEIRAKVADEIKAPLKMALENCTALGRDAYGRYIDNMIDMITNHINRKKAV